MNYCKIIKSPNPCSSKYSIIYLIFFPAANLRFSQLLGMFAFVRLVSGMFFFFKMSTFETIEIEMI